MLCFKFVTQDFKSPGGYSTLDYSGPWPKTLKTAVDPASSGQCARGIHVIPFVEDIDWTNVIYSDLIVMLEVDESDIVYHVGNGKMRCSKAKVLGLPSVEQKRQIHDWVLQHPWEVFQYANYHLGGPTEETRNVCLKEPETAYRYALEIDKKPRDDTRNAALADTASAYSYAMNVDKAAREDTRKACCETANTAYLYAFYLDGAHEDTRRAVLESRNTSDDPDNLVTIYSYGVYVDKLFREDIFNALKGTSQEDRYLSMVDK